MQPRPANQIQQLPLKNPRFKLFLFYLIDIPAIFCSNWNFYLIQILLPERIGWIQLKRMVTANNKASPSTIETTGELDVKILAILSGNAMIIKKNTKPITKELKTETLAANLADFSFPAPISYATRILSSLGTDIH